MYQQFIHWLADNMQPCYFKQVIGADCPGCGIQRSLLFLLQGKISDSILMYPALIPMIFMFLFLVIHLIFKFRAGGTFLMYNFILVVGIMTFNYIGKLLLK
jgi:hypothetical protein